MHGDRFARCVYTRPLYGRREYSPGAWAPTAGATPVLKRWIASRRPSIISRTSSVDVRVCWTKSQKKNKWNTVLINLRISYHIVYTYYIDGSSRFTNRVIRHTHFTRTGRFWTLSWASKIVNPQDPAVCVTSVYGTTRHGGGLLKTFALALFCFVFFF